jgi:DNA-binding protein HU-beta
MNKGDLINKIADQADISKSQAEDALNAALDAISYSLKKDDSVTIVGFGTFSVSHRDARKGRNPRTGETIQIAAKNSIKFKAGKKLNDAVN